MIMHSCHGHMTWFKFKTLVICCLNSHWVLTNWCDPCTNSRHTPMIKIHVHPHIKMITLTLRVTQKHAFSVHLKKHHSFVLSLSLQRFSYAKREVWGYAKKWETYEALKIAREKKKKMEHMKVLKYWKKRREKYSTYFQGN